MALKNMIKVGDKVTFGRSGEKKQSGTVVKCNPKTARIKVSRCGEFLVTYNLIQKPRKAAKKVAPKRKKAPAKRRAAGKKICAVPVKGPRKRKAKKNPSHKDPLGLRNLTPEQDARSDYKKGVYKPKTNFRSYLDRYKLEYEMQERAHGRKNPKKNPYGQELAKLRKKHRQESDWGEDTLGFGTTHPDLYGEEVTGEWTPMQTRPNPAGFTKKGERLYQAIKKGYGRDPRAKEIAARIVYTVARDKPGLVRRSSRRTLRYK